MEKTEGKICGECGGKLVLRCSLCHRGRSRCNTEYCTGEGEYRCKSCGKLYARHKIERQEKN